MSHALHRLGRRCARHPFRTLGVWLLASILIIAMSGTFGRELEDSFAVPGLDSQIALDLLQEVIADYEGTVLIGSRNGALMQLDLASLRLCRRGDLGDMALNLDGTGHDPDRVVTVSASAELVGVVSSKGRHGRLLSNTISNDLSQPTQLPLKGDEHLSELIPLLS